MKRTNASLLFLALLLVIVPVALPLSVVSAQTSSYTISQVDHHVEIMYSGHVVILDTIHVSGQVSDGFMIGLPYKYSADVIKGFAYDDSHLYQLNLGVQLGDRSGFYGAIVDFGGSTPSVFTVAFVLSNRLITEQGSGVSTLDFPAYPSLALDAATCNVTVAFPSSPISLTINKDDGTTNDAAYTKMNLLAYTYAPATADFKVPSGTLQLVTITSLNRQINIDPTGQVHASDTYRIINNSTSTMSSFEIALPPQAVNVAIRDQFGAITAKIGSSANGKILLANATLGAFLAKGQSTTLIAQYNLPSATLEGANYVLGDFKLFPDFPYLVNQATITFTPPEGATIVTPATSLDSSSTLTRKTYQDTLTVTKDGLSYVDYLAPQPNAVALSYNYNPVWASFRPTFWASLLAIAALVAVAFVRRHKPKEETYKERTEQLTAEESASTEFEQPKGEVRTGQRVFPDDIKEFIDAYEDKKQLNAELKSMDAKAQKGKIPRRQYKVQRNAVEVRLAGINRSLERTKQVFRGAVGGYADLVKQLDLAEADLSEAEQNIRTLDARQSRGEISLEVYKRNITDYQKRRDKAESAINGILLRLREKIR